MPLQGVPSLFGGRRGTVAGGGTDIGNGWTLWAHTGAGSANTTSVTSSPGIDTTGADLLIAVVSYYGGNIFLTDANVSDSKSNTWATAYSDTAAGAILVAYSKPTSVGSGHTFSVSGASATYPVITVIAVSGSHATPVDQANSTNGGSGSSSTTGSITPSQNSELIVSGWLLLAANGGAPSIDSSMVITDFTDNDGANHQAGTLAYVTQGVAAAINPTWTWTTSGIFAASITSFKHS